MAKSRNTLIAEAKALFITDEDIAKYENETNKIFEEFIKTQYPAEGMIKIKLTQEVLDDDPTINQSGFKIGDVIEVPLENTLDPNDIADNGKISETDVPPVEPTADPSVVKPSEPTTDPSAVESEPPEPTPLSDKEIAKQEADVYEQYLIDKDITILEKVTGRGKDMATHVITMPRVEYKLIYGGPAIGKTRFPKGFTVRENADGADGVKGREDLFGVGNGVTLHSKQPTVHGTLNNYVIKYTD